MRWSASLTIILLNLQYFMKAVICLHCLEGADCLRDSSCLSCEGVACTRVTSFNIEDNREQALTCLPFDTRNFEVRLLEEQGCRNLGDREVCICYSHDYCNSSPGLSFFFLAFSSLVCLALVLHDRILVEY